VEVQSIPLQGTRVILTFPAALGSSPLLLVRVEDQDFALPLWSVQTVVAPKRSILHVTGSETRLSHEDELLPVLDLGVVLRLRPASTLNDACRLVVIHSRGQRLALVVDEVLGDMELVIRPLPKEVAHIATYQGASTLAGGELVLVLRPDWMVGAGVSTKHAEPAPAALVVDESLIEPMFEQRTEV
jgi:chemotaxis protein histidine kinase CheA